MHELTNDIIKNKNLDKPYEEIAVVEIIFEFIEKIIQKIAIKRENPWSVKFQT